MAVRQARVLDGTHLELLDPIGLPEGARVVVSVSHVETDDDRSAWLAASQGGLEGAYGEDEPEYSLDMIAEENPDFRDA